MLGRRSRGVTRGELEKCKLSDDGRAGKLVTGGRLEAGERQRDKVVGHV